MDYILIYSEYSQSSRKLVEEYPHILQKSISVDSLEMRYIIKQFDIISVPTLIIFNNNNIIDRIIGYYDIVQWLMRFLYQANILQNEVQDVYTESIEEENEDQTTFSENIYTQLADVQPINVQPANVQPINAQPATNVQPINTQPATNTQPIITPMTSVIDSDEYNLDDIVPQKVTQTKQNSNSKTNIDNLSLMDENPGSNETSISGTMQTAEQMKRQRQMDENNFPKQSMVTSSAN